MTAYPNIILYVNVPKLVICRHVGFHSDTIPPKRAFPFQFGSIQKMVKDWHRDRHSRKKKGCKDRVKKYFKGTDHLIF